MSVYARTTYQMYCNGTHKDGPLKGHACYRDFKPPEGLDHTPKPAELRKLAAKEGWTHVPMRIGRKRFDQDYCPDHKPEPEAQQ